MIFALAGKAVAAVQIAGVGHVKAECLDVTGFVFEIKGDIFVDVFAEKLFLRYKLSYVGQAESDLLFVNIRSVTVFFHHRFDDLFFGGVFVHFYDVVGHIVHYMDGTGMDIQHNVITV